MKKKIESAIKTATVLVRGSDIQARITIPKIFGIKSGAVLAMRQENDIITMRVLK